MVMQLRRQFIRYLAVGVSATVLDFLCFALVFMGLSRASSYSGLFPEQLANTAGMLLGFVFTFFVNRSWTFSSQADWRKQMLLALALLGFNILVGAWLISTLIRAAHWPPFWAKFVLQVLLVVWNFIVYKFVIYRQVENA